MIARASRHSRGQATQRRRHVRNIMPALAPTLMPSRRPPLRCRIGAKLCPDIPFSKPDKRWMSATSCPRQHQFGAQAPDRRSAQREAAAIEAGELDHDRQPKPGAGLGLVEPPAAPATCSRCCGDRPGPSSSTTMRTMRRSLWTSGRSTNDLHRDARLRPFAGIVDQIADHLLEVLPLAAEARVLGRIEHRWRCRGRGGSSPSCAPAPSPPAAPRSRCRSPPRGRPAARARDDG